MANLSRIVLYFGEMPLPRHVSVYACCEVGVLHLHLHLLRRRYAFPLEPCIHDANGGRIKRSQARLGQAELSLVLVLVFVLSIHIDNAPSLTAQTTPHGPRHYPQARPARHSGCRVASSPSPLLPSSSFFFHPASHGGRCLHTPTPTVESRSKSVTCDTTLLAVSDEHHLIIDGRIVCRQCIIPLPPRHHQVVKTWNKTRPNEPA